MDPSKQQTDKDNESNSLETRSTVIETPDSADTEGKNTSSSSDESSPVQDATSGAAADSSDTPPQNSAKPPLAKRIWQKFNIYLLLLVLIVLIAIGFTVGLFLKERSDTKQSEASITSQDLSENALKQLANSDVTVGNSNQVLKVESNAIFGGSVLVRNDLEVAGTIKVGGDLQLPGISVSGDSRFNDFQAETMAISGAATVQGPFIARRGIAVTGSSTFDGPISATQIATNILVLNGELRLTNHITAGGPVPGISRGSALGAGGTVSVSGSDTSGSVVINTGGGPGAGCFATIRFARKFTSTPHVIITPVGSGAAGINYYVNRSSNEFSMCTTSPAPGGQTFGFDYMVLN